MIVILDRGHGADTPGKRANGLLEWEFNRYIVKNLRYKLEKAGITVYETITTDTHRYSEMTSEGRKNNLILRSDFANEIYKKYSAAHNVIFISIHANASSTPAASGYEIFVYGLGYEAEKIAKSVYSQGEKVLGIGTDIKSRGIKVGNFHVLRETNMPAILIEHEFYTNLEAVEKLKSTEWRDKAVEHIFKGVCDYYGLGCDIYDDFAKLTPIMGEAKLDASQMKSYLLKYEESPKISCSIDELVGLFLEEGKAEGVRGDVAFAQSLKETGFFRYGGQVLPEQNNYAGIGATNDSSVGKGAWFDTPKDGVRAQIQHLKAYGSNEALNNTCIDPRYHLVPKLGWATYVEYLGAMDNPKNKVLIDRGEFPIGWAYPGQGYGYSIMNMVYKISLEEIINPVEKPPIVQPPEEPPSTNDPIVEEPKDEEEKVNMSLINKILEAIYQLLKKIVGGK